MKEYSEYYFNENGDIVYILYKLFHDDKSKEIYECYYWNNELIEFLKDDHTIYKDIYKYVDKINELGSYTKNLLFLFGLLRY